MKTLKIICTTAFLFLFVRTQSQIINQNPNPNGTPWWTNDAIVSDPSLNPHTYQFVPTPASLALTLPSSVYNDTTDFFPSIINQKGGSCVQVAEIWYTFDYEINRKYGRTAGNGIDDFTNLYNYLFTYNFLNGGSSNSGTYFQSGFNLIMQNGCPVWDVFDDPALDGPYWYKYWMTGYDKYKSGMQNTISGIPLFEFSLVPDLGLNYLKNWVAYHGNASDDGGLAVIGVYSTGWGDNNHILSNSPQHPGEFYIKYLGTTGSHALTIVGYNDNIWIKDINNDGQYTNNQDVNNDGTVNILDYEKGAFKVANSWGTGTPSWPYCNAGFSWLPYHLFYPGNPGFSSSYTVGGVIHTYAYSCDIFETNPVPETKLNVRANLEHECRNKLSLGVGYGLNASQPNPSSSSYVSSFTMKGGCNEMRGAYNGPIDVGIDYSYFYDPTILGKVFFLVTETDSDNLSDGTIHSFSLVDHRWGEDFELPCTQTDVPFVNNGTTTLAIEYHLLPHHQDIINQDNLIVTDNRVSRFTTTVTNGKQLIVRSGRKIDMYNSEIHIDAGSTLELDNDCIITAKRGVCKLVIDGNITVGNNVNFIAEEGAELEIYLNNHDQAITFDGTHFTGCGINSVAQNLTIKNNAVLTNCGAINVYRGNVLIDFAEFNNSYLRLNYSIGSAEFMSTIKNCSFVATETMPAIFMIRAKNYLIQNNHIHGYSYGIQVFYCGYGQNGNRKIIDNTIEYSLLEGIKAYNSVGEISGLNNINNNHYGVGFYNNCNISMKGNSSAINNSQTQQISDNTSYEVYATNSSFPTSFHYNAIIDNDNGGNLFNDPLIFYDRPLSLPYQIVDISLNCWGSSFNATQDLKITNGEFDWTPVWCPGGGTTSINVAEDMYLLAVSQSESGNYSQAKTTFQLLIEQYPNSEYAQAAMKELLRLEAYASTDYDALKDYYLTNNSIVTDSILSKLGDFLANKCALELERWQDAITWYEQQISNPTSVEDSIFAIIDLGDLYLQLQNLGLKSAFTGSLTQFIPENEEKYSIHRDYLLSLFPFNRSKKEIVTDLDGNNHGFLYQNTPNPFAESTQINYNTGSPAWVEISICNLTGKEIACIQQGMQDKGSYTVTFNNAQLPPGFYFYSLKLDGKVISTRKMCVNR